MIVCNWMPAPEVCSVNPLTDLACGAPLGLACAQGIDGRWRMVHGLFVLTISTPMQQPACINYLCKYVYVFQTPSHLQIVTPGLRPHPAQTHSELYRHLPEVEAGLEVRCITTAPWPWSRQI